MLSWCSFVIVKYISYTCVLRTNIINYVTGVFPFEDRCTLQQVVQ